MRLVLVFILLVTHVTYGQQQAYNKVLKLMGTRFEITVVADSEQKGNEYIDAAVTEIERIEKLISSWDSETQTTLINRNAGIKPVQVNKELFDLIQRSIQLSKITDGAFDISYASMDRIWKFDGSMTVVPTEEVIRSSVKNVGYKKIILNKENQSVFLKEKGMKIGFGGIGKGYAADKAKDLLVSMGVNAGIVNASGDLNAWGTQPDGSNWMVGITNPLNSSKIFSWLPVNNQSVVTSGNYEKFAMIDGKRFAHIIDPKTGYPTTGVKSVTVFAHRAELADALATSVFVMGVRKGIDFIDQLDGIEAIIVDDNNKFHKTKTLEFKTNIE